MPIKLFDEPGPKLLWAIWIRFPGNKTLKFHPRGSSHRLDGHLKVKSVLGSYEAPRGFCPYQVGVTATYRVTY